MVAMQGVKQCRQVTRKLKARVESGAEAAAALLISPRGGGAAAGAAASGAAASGMAAAAAASAGGLKEPAGTVMDVTIGGGVADTGSDDEAGEDSKVPVGTVSEFKRKVRLFF